MGSLILEMSDVFSKEKRSEIMSQIKGKNTKPEIKFRKYIWSKGLNGYRIHTKLPGKPDIVFTKYKLAVFIDGCFWHKCPIHYKEPVNNEEYWKNKIKYNIEKDKRINEELKKQGWKVTRFWEHDVNKDIENCYEKIKEFIN